MNCVMLLLSSIPRRSTKHVHLKIFFVLCLFSLFVVDIMSLKCVIYFRLLLEYEFKISYTSMYYI